MFEDLGDAFSILGSWRWPEAVGEVTATRIDGIKRMQNDVRLRLAVAYKFSVNGDGPYTGESFWNPAFFVNRRVLAARFEIRLRQPVIVRYKSDDPSLSRLDRRVWESL